MTTAPSLGRSAELTPYAIRLVQAARDTLVDASLHTALRRGLGQAPHHPAMSGAHRTVAPCLPPDPDAATEWAWYTVAAMIAAQPGAAREQDTESAASEAERQRPCLGEALARAVAADRLEAATAEARIQLLARQHLRGLHRQLPRLVAHLRVHLVPVDWVRLLLDLARWNGERDQVAAEWLQAYRRTLAALTAGKDPEARSA